VADFVSLNALVEAIAGAVTDAQTEIERSQIAGLARFLDGDGRPATLQVRLPSIRPDAAPGQEDVYSAPLLALLPHSPLRIKQAEISFDVQLGALSAPRNGAKEKSAATPALAGAAVRQTLSVDPAPGADAAKAGTVAHVVLTVECLEQPEGLARLIAEMVKTQGVRPSGPGDTPTGVPPSPTPGPTPPKSSASGPPPSDAARSPASSSPRSTRKPKSTPRPTG
jgi:hypothetical protein